MKEITTKIKDFIPYFFIISVYFFFVNIEARKEQKDSNSIDNTILLKKEDSEKTKSTTIIQIPVIPYNQ